MKRLKREYWYYTRKPERWTWGARRWLIRRLAGRRWMPYTIETLHEKIEVVRFTDA